MTASDFWLGVAPFIVFALVAFWAIAMPVLGVILAVRWLRAERRRDDAACAQALRELSDAIADGRPSNETNHEPAGELVPLYTAPSFGRRSPGGAA